MTIEDLIKEGETFNVQKTEPNMYFQNGINIIQGSVKYLENGDRFLLWIEKCKRFLALNYKGDIAYENFEIASKNLPNSNGDIYKLVAILKSIKELPSKCVRPSYQNSSDKVVVNVNQSVNIDIVLHAIQEEIGKAGIKNLKDAGGKDKENIKRNVISKLAEFGENTLSNILANILTNPSIWSQL